MDLLKGPFSAKYVSTGMPKSGSAERFFVKSGSAICILLDCRLRDAPIRYVLLIKFGSK